MRSVIASVLSNANTTTDSRTNMLNLFNNCGLDKKGVEDEIVGMIAAGTETTGTALTWILYAFAKYPTIQQKVSTQNCYFNKFVGPR